MTSLSSLLIHRLAQCTTATFIDGLVKNGFLEAKTVSIDGVEIRKLVPAFETSRLTGNVDTDLHYITKTFPSFLKNGTAPRKPMGASEFRDLLKEAHVHEIVMSDDDFTLDPEELRFEQDRLLPTTDAKEPKAPHYPGDVHPLMQEFLEKRQVARSKEKAAQENTLTETVQAPKTVKLKSTYVLQLLRHLAPRPSVSHLIVTVMLGHALDQMSRTTLQSVLKRPNPILVINAKTEGFERAFADILSAGVVSKRPTQTIDVLNRFSRAFRDDLDQTLEDAVAASAVARFDGQWFNSASTKMVKRLTLAVEKGLPSVVVTEAEDKIQPVVLSTADLVLTIDRIDKAMLMELLGLLYADGNTKEKARIAGLVKAAPFYPQWLAFDDYVLALRPERSLEDILAALRILADEREVMASDMVSDSITDEINELKRMNGETGDVTAEIQAALKALDEEADQSQEPKPSSTKAGKDQSTPKPVSKQTEKFEKKSETNSAWRGKLRGSGSVIIEPDPLYVDETGTALVDTVNRAKRALTVETLAGYGEAKDWALNLKGDLELWNKGDVEWTDLSTKLLLSGPPGTGKTTFAKALGNTLQLPVYVSSVSTWLQCSHLGDVINRMCEVFKEVEDAKPAILLIDEIDSIGKRQDSSREYSDYWNAVVAKALELLDGAVKNEGIIVIGACNHPKNIDEAICRSGRLEKHIQIPRPDTTALIGIIEHHIGNDITAMLASVNASVPQEVMTTSSPNPKTVDLKNSTVSIKAETDFKSSMLRRLALKAAGMTGADIERLIRETRQKSRRSKQPMTFTDVETALKNGRKTRPDHIRKAIAIHEAGHAIVNHYLGLGRITMITIDSAEGGFMATDLDLNQLQSETQLQNHLAMLLAGRAAEKIFLKQSLAGSGGARDSDLARATMLATAMETSLGFSEIRPLIYVSEDEAQRYLVQRTELSQSVHARLEAAEKRATEIVEQHCATLQKLADRLVEAEVLETNEILEIVGAK